MHKPSLLVVTSKQERERERERESERVLKMHKIHFACGYFQAR